MIEYDILGKLYQSGVLHPVVWLSKTLKCSKSKASNILNGTSKNVNPRDLTRICLKLGCVPHDLMVWKTDSKFVLPLDHPLQQAIRKKQKLKSVDALLASHPPAIIEQMFNQLKEFEK